MLGPPIDSDYRILVSQGWRRPKAEVIAFGVRDLLPPLAVPLRRYEPEPRVDVASVLRALYDRASYDLRIDYRQPPVPPLARADAEWAARCIEAAGATRPDDRP